jgi:hypothetical protein
MWSPFQKLTRSTLLNLNATVSEVALRRRIINWIKHFIGLVVLRASMWGASEMTVNPKVSQVLRVCSSHDTTDVAAAIQLCPNAAKYVPFHVCVSYNPNRQWLDPVGHRMHIDDFYNEVSSVPILRLVTVATVGLSYHYSRFGREKVANVSIC